jgi:hypothetical protein
VYTKIRGKEQALSGDNKRLEKRRAYCVMWSMKWYWKCCGQGLKKQLKKGSIKLRFESTVFWDVTLKNLVQRDVRFEGITVAIFRVCYQLAGTTFHSPFAINPDCYRNDVDGLKSSYFYSGPFLGAFAKLLRHVCSSLRMEKNWVPLNWFLWNFTLDICQKSVQKIQVVWKFDNENGYFSWLPVYS